MSERNRSDRGALVALGLILAAVCFVAVLDAWSRQPFQDDVSQRNTATTEAYQEQRGPAEGYWWPEFAARDTYAQWAMAVLALAATALSVMGVVLIRRTFEETKRTADAAIRANQISIEAQRAWMRIVNVECSHFVITEKGISAGIYAEAMNIGGSPARWVRFRFSLLPYVQWSEEKFRADHEAFGMPIGAGLVFQGSKAVSGSIGVSAAQGLWDAIQSRRGSVLLFLVAEVLYLIESDDLVHKSAVIYQMKGKFEGNFVPGQYDAWASDDLPNKFFSPWAT